MQNLEQIRAKAAFDSAQNLKRSAINKLPGLIINNGLLATAAFCETEGGGENKIHLKNAMIATMQHLAERGIILAATSPNITEDGILKLSQQSSLKLQRATTESLAFLSYLKRFASND